MGCQAAVPYGHYDASLPVNCDSWVALLRVKQAATGAIISTVHHPYLHLMTYVLQGVKLELFIFDTFPLAQRAALLEVQREHQFAPVKNAPGTGKDDPDTARGLNLAQHAW